VPCALCLAFNLQACPTKCRSPYPVDPLRLYHSPHSDIARMASMQLPDGLVPTDHNSIASTIIRLNAAFVAVIVIIISVRLYVRLRLVRRLGSDDGRF
jgi:hypothetical protein